MKTKILITALLLTSCGFLCAQTDPWEQIIDNGFGDVNNTEIDEFFIFNSNLYAATRRPTTTGAAQLWKSATGNNGDWTNVTSFSPTIPAQANAIPSVHVTNFGGGIAYFGTTNMIGGGAVYQSTNGTNWTQINTNGFGNNKNFLISPSLFVFEGNAPDTFLYAGTRNTTTGAQLWRTPYKNTITSNWTMILDFATVDTSVETVTYGYAWNNKLYIGTDGTSGQIFESTDGITWTKNTGVGNGFGVSTNKNIASLVEFNGFLYVTTFNSTTGGQLWKTNDGITWTSVTTNAFGKGNAIDELHNLRVAYGKLWITGQWAAATASPTVV